MGFRPQFWPTLITVPALIALIGLGTWQVQRLYWKEALIAERGERLALPPLRLPLPQEAVGSLALFEYRRAVAVGEFRHDKELYLAARTWNGNPGYHVVTPLLFAEGGGLLVDRGWVPIELKDPAARALGQLAGRTAVEGVIRLPGRQNWLVPENQPADNLWFWMDLPAMAAHAGVDGAVAGLYLDAGPAENPGGFPLGGQTRVSLPNDHLQYALTWYALAVALAVIYYLYHRRESGT